MLNIAHANIAHVNSVNVYNLITFIFRISGSWRKMTSTNLLLTLYLSTYQKKHTSHHWFKSMPKKTLHSIYVLVVQLDHQKLP